jgi:hypothetical protein
MTSKGVKYTTAHTFAYDVMEMALVEVAALNAETLDELSSWVNGQLTHPGSRSPKREDKIAKTSAANGSSSKRSDRTILLFAKLVWHNGIPCDHGSGGHGFEPG